MVMVKLGQLACREHWLELPARLRDQLVSTWEARKENPEVPELVHLHRTLLVAALRAWRVPIEVSREALKRAPRAAPVACPWCGAAGPHLDGCNRPEGLTG